VKHVQAKADQSKENINIPKLQRRAPPPSLETLMFLHPDRNQAIIAAYANGAYSYQQISDFFGMHFTTVGKIVRETRSERKAKI
jgi:DNA-directed RNA polymerase specialized sigma24 family protein